MKYEILKDQTIVYKGQTLYRIRALKDIQTRPWLPKVRAGLYGGYVQGPHNLSQEGNCWVYPQACAFNQASITDNAVLTGRARAGGYCTVRDDAEVGGESVVTGNGKVCDEATVLGRCRIQGDSVVRGAAKLLGSLHLSGNAVVRGTCEYHMGGTLSDYALIESTNDLFVADVVGPQARPFCIYLDADNAMRTNWDGNRGGFVDDFLIYVQGEEPELYEEYLLLVEAADLRFKRLKGS